MGLTFIRFILLWREFLRPKMLKGIRERNPGEVPGPVGEVEVGPAQIRSGYRRDSETVIPSWDTRRGALFPR